MFRMKCCRVAVTRRPLHGFAVVSISHFDSFFFVLPLLLFESFLPSFCGTLHYYDYIILLHPASVHSVCVATHCVNLEWHAIPTENETPTYNRPTTLTTLTGESCIAGERHVFIHNIRLTYKYGNNMFIKMVYFP